MFRFKLKAETFNKLQRRLVGVAASDKDAEVIFTLEESKLTVRYRSKLGRSETTSLFSEILDTSESENTGSSTILVQELTGIRLEPMSKEGKFPFTEDIQFHFQNSVLRTNWKVNHTDKRSSEVKLAHAIKENLPDLSAFTKLDNLPDNFINMQGPLFQETISYCNLFKMDATSKTSNGCLFEVSGDFLVAVGTDSIVASKFKAPIDSQHITDGFRLVLDSSVLIFIKTFINDLDNIKLSASKRFLFISSEGRSMCVPTMNVIYNIKDPEEFFKVDSPFIGTIDPSPVISVLNTLTHLSTDVHSKIMLDFNSGNFNVSTSKNSSEHLPCDLVSEALINVNSGLFLTSIKKLESFEKSPVQLFFNIKNRRIMLSSKEKELVFLIQGMRD